MNTIDNSQYDKLLTFRLYGNFAHFNQPLSNRFKNSYSIIPKPQLLGMIGSIIGLKGYVNTETLPEFYKKLKNLKVYIKPNNCNIKSFMVKYNSFNSFLNNISSNYPNVFIMEQILLNPDYEIGILLNTENKIHKKIVKKIKYEKSFFNPYLGKNEFPANIQYISLKNYKVNHDIEINCKSIISFDEVKNETTGNTKFERLPIKFDKNFKYIYETMLVPQKKINNILLNNPESCINSEGNVYYVY